MIQFGKLSYIPEECFEKRNGEYVMTDIILLGHIRTDLKCRKVNTAIPLCYTFKTQICACTTTPTWTLDNSTTGFLELEYLTRKGHSRIAGTNNVKDMDYDYLFLHKPNSFLSHIPVNICEYPTIINIIMSKNRITTLTDFGCISRLTSLDLSYNRIVQIKKSHFEGLRYLKDLILSHNRISYIEPETFNQNSLGLINLDVSHNLLTIIDISNILLPKTFCRISYKANGIFDFRNDGPNPVKGSDTIGNGGTVDLSSNGIQRVPNPTRLGIGQGYEIYGKIFFNRFVFLVRDNPLSCDCFMEEFLRNAKNVLDYFYISEDLGYSCHSPLRLRGTSIVEEFIKPGDFSQLTCKLPFSCPKHCSCVFQSNNDTIVVECRLSYNGTSLPGFNLTDMTRSVRNHTRYQNATLHLRFLSGNIRVLDQHSYLVNTSYINISQNSISLIEEAAMKNLTSSFAEKVKLDLTGNTAVLKLPSRMRHLKPHIVHMRNTRLLCDCNLMSWFPQWLENGSVNKTALNITCSIEGRAIPFENVNPTDLNCEEGDFDYFLAYLLGIILVISLLLYFLLEKHGLPLFVYYKSNIQKKGNQQQLFMYDVYISCDETNEVVFCYIIREFIPMLSACNLKPFFLAQDAAIGDVTEESIIHNLSASRYYVFFLTSSVSDILTYEKGRTFCIEWKHAWNRYAFSKGHDIVLINFDLLRFSNIKDRRMKAIKAFGHVVNFSDVDFKSKMIKLLNKRSRSLPNKIDYNSKTKFNLSSLNQRKS